MFRALAGRPAEDWVSKKNGPGAPIALYVPVGMSITTPTHARHILSAPFAAEFDLSNSSIAYL